LASALGDTACNIGEAKDTTLGTAGALAAPPCNALAGGCRPPTGREVAAQLGRAKDATGGAIGTVVSDASAAIRPGCVPVLQHCRLDTLDETLRTEYGIYAGLYGGVNALTFGGEANLGAYAGLDNSALQCMPEFQQGAHLAQAGGVALGVYGAARSAIGLARGISQAAVGDEPWQLQPMQQQMQRAIPAGSSTGSISMDNAIDQAVQHVGPDGRMETTAGGNYQFRSNTVDPTTGQTTTRIARLDVNPGDPHVAQYGPHLNLNTHVSQSGTRGVIRVPVPGDHTPIDPTTIRPGDIP